MAAKSDAWMPFYVADYLADTTHLTTEQHGAYVLLILACWKRGGFLPDDDQQLAAICRLTPAAWRRHRGVLAEFFSTVGSELVHGRVQREVERAREITEKRRIAGLQGGRPPKQIESNPKANGIANGKQNETPARVALPSPSPRDSELVLDPESPEKTDTQLRRDAPNRGARIKPNWSPSADNIVHAIREGFSEAEVQRMAENFRDYWTAASGKTAIKLDWSAAWRTWVRKEADNPRRPRRAEPKQVDWC